MDLRIKYKLFLQLLEEVRIIQPGVDPQTINLPETEILLQKLGEAGVPPLAFRNILEQTEAFRRDQMALRAILQERAVLMPPGMEALLAEKATTPEMLTAVAQHLEHWEAMVNKALTLNWNKPDRIPFARLGIHILAYRRFADDNERKDLSLTARIVHLTFVRHSEFFTRDEPGQIIVELGKPLFREKIATLAQRLERHVPDLTDVHLDAQVLLLQVSDLALEGLAEDRALLAKARVLEPAKALPLLKRLAADAEKVGKILNASFHRRAEHITEITDLRSRLQTLQRAIATEVDAATRAAPAEGSKPVRVAPQPPPTPPSVAPQVPAMNLTQMSREVQLLLDVVNHFPPPTNQPTANDLETFNEPLNDYYEHHRDYGLPQLALAAIESRRLGTYAEYRLSKTAYTPTIEGRFHQAARRITERTGLPYTWRELDEFATSGLIPIAFDLALLDLTIHLDRFPPVTDQNRTQATAVLRKMETVLDVLDRYDQAISAAGGSRLDLGSRLMQTSSEIRARIQALTQPQPKTPAREAPPVSKVLAKAAATLPSSLRPKTSRKTVVPDVSPSPSPPMPIITLAQLLRKAGNNEDLGWWMDLTKGLDAAETFAINQWLIDNPEFIANVRYALANHDEIDWAPLEEALVEHVAGYERIDALEDRTAHRSAMSARFKEAKRAARITRTIFEA